MEIARILRRGREPAGELLEIVTPRTGAGAISAAEGFFASVSLPEAFSLEVVATANARWFLVRARTPEALDRLEGQLGAVYPEADLRDRKSVV